MSLTSPSVLALTASLEPSASSSPDPGSNSRKPACNAEVPCLSAAAHALQHTLASFVRNLVPPSTLPPVTHLTNSLTPVLLILITPAATSSTDAHGRLSAETSVVVPTGQIFSDSQSNVANASVSPTPAPPPTGFST